MINAILIAGALLGLIVLIYNVDSFNSEESKIHREKLCKLYGHALDWDVLETDANGDYFVSHRRCSRCDNKIPVESE